MRIIWAISHAVIALISSSLLLISAWLLLKLPSISALEILSFEGFRAYTINFIYGGLLLNSRISGTLIIATWIILASILNLIWHVIISKKIYPLTFYLIFLTGWLGLDMRWQLELMRQRELTMYKYASQTATAKRLHGRDGSLFNFITTVKNFIPTAPQRILLILGDPDTNNLALARASYFLRPHNVYAEDVMPLCQNRLKTGDYVLILGMPKTLQYTAQHLSWAGCNALAERVLATAAGQLFLVK